MCIRDSSCTVAKYNFYCSRRTYSYLVLVSLPLAPTVETRSTELRFSSRCPRRHLVHAGLAIAAATVFLDRAAEEQTTLYTDCCCCRAKYDLPNHFLKTAIIRAPARSTAVNNILSYSTRNGNSSAWNHIFNFQRRGPPRRRPQKPLSLCHTHGSAPRSPCLPCQIMVQRESSKLEQNYGMSYRKN